VVIQGFGNVGGMAAKLMSAMGFHIVAIVEYDGAVYNPHGLDIAALQKHRQETGSITGFAGGEDMDKAEAMFLDCDVLIPAATENVITSQNADRLRCKILCEGANGPTTPLADLILADKNVFVIPDILANAGGVTVSYFEWVQDRQGYFWNEQLVNSRLQEIMDESFDAVVQFAGQAPRQQSHRGVHAGPRSRGQRHPAAGNLRVSDVAQTLVSAAPRLRTPEIGSLFGILEENGLSYARDKLKHVPQKAHSAFRCGACFLPWRVKLACRHENRFSPNSMTSGVRRFISARRVERSLDPDQAGVPAPHQRDHRS
jgi:hypothetical protein